MLIAVATLAVMVPMCIVLVVVGHVGRWIRLWGCLIMLQFPVVVPAIETIVLVGLSPGHSTHAGQVGSVAG